MTLAPVSGQGDPRPASEPLRGAPGTNGGAWVNSARDALEGAVTAIAAAGVDTPRLDAEVLLAHVLGVSRARLLSDRELAVGGSAVRAFQDAVRRRSIARE